MVTKKKRVLSGSFYGRKVAVGNEITMALFLGRFRLSPTEFLAQDSVFFLEH